MNKETLVLKIKYLILITIAAFTLGFAAACQKAANNDVTVKQAETNTGANQAEVKKEVPKTETTTSSAFSLATPSDAYKTAYNIREKKDLEGLKKVLSDDILEFFAEVAKADNKTLDDQLKELFDKPQAKTAEVRNEKISGDRAVLEYLDENGKWKEMDFEKDGNEWKLTIPKMDGPPKKP